ncbi:hypothetical protein [Rahnella sp. PCH160]|uniref:hypothetical protein n=1 Tax=Rahnella sp. PCH160 TaxID=3447928 RepID=UPI0039FB95ED
MDRFERISFVIPFDDQNELIQPKTKFSVGIFPSEITLNTRVGFVGLMPLYKYNIKMFIQAIHITIKKGEEAQLLNPFTELASVEINTKGTILGGEIDGQVVVKLEKLNIPAKGIYQIRCEIMDSKDTELALHTNVSFFSVD